MNFLNEFNRIMAEHTEIALATSVAGHPNVRVVNFYYDSETKVMYFSSFVDNQKVIEFEENPLVAFTTLTSKGEEHVRVKDATIKKSNISVYEIKDKFLSKIPEYIMKIPEVLDSLILFEIHFHRADVVIDFENIENIAL